MNLNKVWDKVRGTKFIKVEELEDYLNDSSLDAKWAYILLYMAPLNKGACLLTENYIFVDSNSNYEKIH